MTTLSYQPQSSANIVSEGQRLLRLLQVSDSKVGKEVGRTRITINGWRTGRVKPDLASRKTLERLFGIGTHTWEMVPQSKEAVHRNFVGGVTPPKNSPAPKPPPEPGSMGDDPVEPASPESEFDGLSIRNLAVYGSKHSDPLPDSREALEQLLKSLRSARNNRELLPTDRVKLATAETRAYAILAKMDRDNEMSEDRIIRNHPQWQKMRAAMITALKPFPDAMRAVVEALKSVEMNK